MGASSIKLGKILLQPPLLPYKKNLYDCLFFFMSRESRHWEKSIGTIKLDKLLTSFLGTWSDSPRK